MKIVILAGGMGTRFWPLTRDEQPKQLCRLISSKTLLEETLDRFSSWPSEKIFISTTRGLLPKICKLLPDFTERNYIVEPALRDTAPAMGYVAAWLSRLDGEEPIAFVPADHFIGKKEKFLLSLREAEKVICETGKLLDISVTPSGPVTTLGYTKIGKLVRQENGVDFYEFLGHKEKPDQKTAEKYFSQGGYLWHANYYMWTPRKFLESYKKYAPSMYLVLEKIKNLLGEGAKLEVVAKLYEELEKTSFDYAITEKMNSEEILIIKGDFFWDDIGAWNTLYQNALSRTDKNRNLVRGEALMVDTQGCLLYGRKGKMIATLGLENLVIVDTEDALLVCPQARAQEVKKIIEELRKKGKKYL